jgi:hypothetical protein
MDYPVLLSFKLLALGNQIYVRDASQNLIFYVKQKLLKLKESVGVYTDDQQQQLLCHIGADRIIDFSATYYFTTASDHRLGGMKRKGMKSMFKAEYDIFLNAPESPDFTLKEDSIFVRIMDSILGDIAIIGLFSGYFFNPTYTITRSQEGTPVLTIKKGRSFMESKFTINKVGDLSQEEETALLLGILMMTCLERTRG